MPELRRDPLIGRWVIIASERARRPIDFVAQHDAPSPADACPFCRGREAETPAVIVTIKEPGLLKKASDWRVRVVPSIKPLLSAEGGLNRRAKGMYDVMSGVGVHEVIVETPDHQANAADLPPEQLHRVLEASVGRIRDLERDPRLRYVLWFKNYGEVAGAGRIQHARSQLIGTPVTPKRVKEELVGARRYYDEKERCLICDVVAQEREAKVRVALESDHVIALCPFASRFPFELWIGPKTHQCDFAGMSAQVLRDLAQVLQQVLSRLKRVLDDPPYNCVLHTAPFRRPKDKVGHWKTIEEDFHWHLELMPRLTRIAGFEWGSGFYINPTPPEEAAKYLREAAS